MMPDSTFNKYRREERERRAQVRKSTGSIEMRQAICRGAAVGSHSIISGSSKRNNGQSSVSWSRFCKYLPVLSVAIEVVSILTLMAANFRSASCLLTSGVQNSVLQSGPQFHLGAVQQKCLGGAPVQWRPYLDVASKAHLAPVVAIGSLRHLSLTPIPLSSNLGESLSSSSIQQQQPIAFHAQNINNVGINIEATFSIVNVLKRTIPMNLNASQTIKLFYKVSASLSTTSALMTLANSNAAEQNPTAQSSRVLLPPTGSGISQQHSLRQLVRRERALCALDLSEHELEQKASKIFKLNKNYILFLDQVSSAPHASWRSQSGLKPQGAAGLDGVMSQPHPFASHELLTNQTSRALRKILCKNCGKLQSLPG